MAKEHLLKNNLSLVIVKDGEVLFESRGGGVKGLLEALRYHGERLAGSALADKVVGKAAMLIALKAGFNAIYAKVLSASALEVASKSNVTLLYDEMVDFIMDREGKDMCPFERAVNAVEDPEKAYRILAGIVFGGQA